MNVDPDPSEPSPEKYDQLLASLLWARDDMRREGIPAWARAFEDAATVAAESAAALRGFAEGKAIYVPSKSDWSKVMEELDELARVGITGAEAFRIIFPPQRFSPAEVGPCIICCEDFMPGALAVKAPSNDEIGFSHLECLHVVIVEERA